MANEKKLNPIEQAKQNLDVAVEACNSARDRMNDLLSEHKAKNPCKKIVLFGLPHTIVERVVRDEAGEAIGARLSVKCAVSKEVLATFDLTAKKS